MRRAIPFAVLFIAGALGAPASGGQSVLPRGRRVARAWAPSAPQNIPSMTMPWVIGSQPGTQWVVNNSSANVNTAGSLPYACAHAVDNDEIVLGDAGTPRINYEYTTFFTQCAKTTSGWVIIRPYLATDGAFPNDTTRIDPTAHAGAAGLLARLTINQFNNPILRFVDARGYRIIGVEFAPKAGTQSGTLVEANGTSQSIILDRVWLHGDVEAGTITANGLGFDKTASNLALINSYCNDIGSLSAGAERQCVTSESAKQVYLHNNLLNAAGESILFGGGNSVPSDTYAADWLVTQNHFVNWPQWYAVFPNQYIGAPTTQSKNIGETKTCVRCELSGNVFDTKPKDAQTYAVSMKVTLACVDTPARVLTDINFTNNIMSRVSQALNWAYGYDGSSPASVCDPAGGQTVVRVGYRQQVVNNLFLDVCEATYGVEADISNPFLFQHGADYIRFAHNVLAYKTGCVTPKSGSYQSGFQLQSENVRHQYGLHQTFSYNYMGNGQVQAIGGDASIGTGCTAGQDSFVCALELATFEFKNNMLGGETCGDYSTYYDGVNSPACPATGFFRSNTACVIDLQDFEDAPNGDFRIKASSPLYNTDTALRTGLSSYAAIPNCPTLVSASMGASATCPIIPLANPITVASIGAFGGAGTCDGTNTASATGTNFKRGMHAVFDTGTSGTRTILTEENGQLTIVSATSATMKPTHAAGTVSVAFIYAGIMQGGNTDNLLGGAKVSATCN